MQWPRVTRELVVEQHLLSDGLAQSLVRNSSDGLVVIDRQGRISYASPAAEAMLGYAPGSARGLDAFELVHPEDQVNALEGFESTLSAKDSRPLPVLVRLRRADGAWHQTEVIGTNRLDDDAHQRSAPEHSRCQREHADGCGAPSE